MSENKEKELTPEEEFSKIFDEISKDGAEIPTQDEVVPSDQTPDVEKEGVDEEYTQTDERAGLDKEGTPNDPNVSTGEDGKINYEDLYNKEVQKTRSWDGRIRAANERAAKAEGEVQKLIEEMNSLKEKGTNTPPQKSDNTPIEDDPDIKQFFEDYPELVKPFEKLVVTKGAEIARKVVEDRLSEYIPKLNRLEAEIAESTTDKHFARITAVHPDWVNMVDSGEVSKWVESQPSFLQPELRRIVNKGSTEEAIELLNQVKNSRGRRSTTQEKKPAKKDPKNLLAVPASSTEVPKDEKEKDFDYWWDKINKG